MGGWIAFVATATFVATAPAAYAAPANDNFANAAVLTGTAGEIGSVDTSGSTLESGEPVAVAGQTGSIWYRWRSPARTTEFEIGLDADSPVAVYTGASLGGLTRLSKVEDFSNRGGVNIVVGFLAKPSTTYWIQIGPSSSNPFYLYFNARTVKSMWPAAAGNGTSALVVRLDDTGPFSCIRAAKVQGTTVSNAWTDIECAFNNGATDEWVGAPAIAWNGSRYLVAWGRSSQEYWGECGGTLRGAILDVNAKVQNYLNISPPIAQSGFDAPCTEVVPSVAALGTNFLAAWGQKPGVGDASVYARRISGAGVPLGAAPSLVSGAAGSQSAPSVAAGGGSWLVAWQDARSAGTTGIDIYSTRISSTGAIASPGGVALSKPVKDQWDPALAWNGTSFFAAWSDGRNQASTSHDVFGTLVSAAGAPSTLAGIAVSKGPGRQNTPSLAASGANFVVAWQDDRGDPDFDIYANRVSSTGAVLHGTGFKVGGTAARQAHPVVVGVGSGIVLVLWEDERNGAGNEDLYAARISSAGAVLDASGFAVAR
jgi:hypothetical protein